MFNLNVNKLVINQTFIHTNNRIIIPLGIN